MEPLPPLPAASEVPDLFESGHLWVQELVVGVPVRFQLDETGRLAVRAGDREIAGDPPPSLAHAVRYLAERLDREALLEVADDPASVTFAGVATRYEGVDYDFARLPGVVGTDVHSASRGRWLPPDVVERTFDRLGLDPVATVAQEVRASDFDPAGYELPDSTYMDGPAAGVVVRNKAGGRAAIRHEGVASTGSNGISGRADPAELAAAVVTPARLERARRVAGAEAGFDAVFERVLELVRREEHGRLPAVDERAFRSAVVERVRDTAT